MKKLSLLLVAILALCSTNSFAQSANRWGLSAGLNFNKAKEVGTGYSNKMQTGVNIGGVYQHLFDNGLLLDLGLNLDSKAIKGSADGEYVKRTALGLKTPIHIGYMYHVNNDFAIFATGGTYFTLGLSGEYKGRDIDGETDTIDLYESGNGDKRFEMGLGMKVGVEFIRHIQVSLGYDYGLTKLNKNGDDLKNRTINLSVAYLF